MKKSLFENRYIFISKFYHEHEFTYVFEHKSPFIDKGDYIKNRLINILLYHKVQDLL